MATKKDIKIRVEKCGSRPGLDVADVMLGGFMALVLFFNCSGTGNTIMHALPNTEACEACGEWMSTQSPGCACEEEDHAN